MSDPQPGTLEFAHRQNPTAEALVQGSTRRTWRDWSSRATSLASWLRERLDIEAGDRVAWMLQNRLEYYDLAFALEKLGAVGVPIGYRLTGPEAAYIVDNSDSKAVVCQGRFAAELESALADMPRVPEDRFLVTGSDAERAGALAKAIHFEDAIIGGRPDELDPVDRATGSIIYTSGTTGRPKGAYRDLSEPGKAEALREFQVGIVTGFGYGPGDKHLLSCPLYHSAPPVFANISHVFGGCVTVMERFDPEKFLRTIQDEAITSAFVVPTQLNRICALPESVRSSYDLSSMQRLLVGAAPFPYPLKQRVIELFPNPCVYEFYGSTETAINTIIKPEDQLRKPGSCGQIVPGNEIKILDDDGNEVATGEVGTLYVKNAFIITGYYKDTKATAECFRGEFFTVGDVAYVDQDGFYYIVDRKKDMVISGGVNIYPAEVEAELRKHPAVFDCGVIGIPNEEWGEEVKAIVQLREGQHANAEELDAFLAEHLADYKRPRSYDFVDELPYNPSGKLLKKELRQRYWGDAGRTI